MLKLPVKAKNTLVGSSESLNRIGCLSSCYLMCYRQYNRNKGTWEIPNQLSISGFSVLVSHDSEFSVDIRWDLYYGQFIIDKFKNIYYEINLWFLEKIHFIHHHDKDLHFIIFFCICFGNTSIHMASFINWTVEMHIL